MSALFNIDDLVGVIISYLNLVNRRTASLVSKRFYQAVKRLQVRSLSSAQLVKIQELAQRNSPIKYLTASLLDRTRMALQYLLDRPHFGTVLWVTPLGIDFQRVVEINSHLTSDKVAAVRYELHSSKYELPGKFVIVPRTLLRRPVFKEPVSLCVVEGKDPTRIQANEYLYLNLNRSALSANSVRVYLILASLTKYYPEVFKRIDGDDRYVQVFRNLQRPTDLSCWGSVRNTHGENSRDIAASIAAFQSNNMYRGIALSQRQIMRDYTLSTANTLILTFHNCDHLQIWNRIRGDLKIFYQVRSQQVVAKLRALFDSYRVFFPNLILEIIN